MMRFLHIVEDLGIGGTERLLEGLLPRLKVHGHDVMVFSLWGEGPIAESLRKKGVEVRNQSLSNYWNPVQIAALNRSIRKLQPDIIHSHGSFANVFAGFAASLLRGVPLLIHHHTEWTGDHPWRQVFAEKWAAGRADRILSVSRAVARSVIEEGIGSERKVEVLYNGVDLQRFPFRKRSVGGGIVSVGSLVPHKGQEVLIRAMTDIRSRVPDSTLTIVGDGSERARLERLSDELDMKGAVRFTGRVADVGEYLSDADLFALPSLEREGLGISILEAMASGLPVVATECGGIVEIVENERNGLLVPPGDSAALSNALLRLMQERELSVRMAENARDRVEKEFTLEKMCTDLLDIYKGITGE